jgi:ribosomal protein S18 acetylase RimI-like enzyme
MIREFEKYLSKNDENIYGLSVKKSNQAAIRFYDNSGYEFDYQSMDSVFYIMEISIGEY